MGAAVLACAGRCVLEGTLECAQGGVGNVLYPKMEVGWRRWRVGVDVAGTGWGLGRG